MSIRTTNFLRPNGSGADLTGLTGSQVSGLESSLALLAPLASPTFSGTVSVEGGSSTALTAPSLNFSAPTDMSGSGSLDGLGYLLGNLLFFESGVLALVLSDNLKNFRVPSTYTYSWSASSANTLEPDTGFLRQAAGVIRLGIASGNNALIVGCPTASTVALTVTAAPGQTSDLTQWVTTTGAVISGVSGGGISYTASGNTPSRPSVSSVGSQYFDTTLGIPIWWNGSTWVNSSGTIV